MKMRTMALLLVSVCPMMAGRLVVNHDEWTTRSDGGFLAANAANTTTFLTNVAGFLAGAPGANILIYSSDVSLTNSNVSTTLTNAGYNVTVSTGAFNPLGFSAVFLAGNIFSATTTALVNFVNGGGGVYLAGGTGAGGAANEAARWNPFLNTFGFAFGSPYNGIGGTDGTDGGHAIFNGVSSLYYDNGSPLSLTGGNPNASIVERQNTVGALGAPLIGVYDSTVPEPGTYALIGSALTALALIRRRSTPKR